MKITFNPWVSIGIVLLVGAAFGSAATSLVGRYRDAEVIGQLRELSSQHADDREFNTALLAASTRHIVAAVHALCGESRNIPTRSRASAYGD